MEVLCQIGQHESDNSNFESAVEWFRRAFIILHNRDSLSLNAEVEDLGLTVLHTYTRLLFAHKTTEHDAEASRALALLQHHHGHKLAVTVLELEISVRAEVFDTDAFCTSLRRLFGTMHLIAANHNVVMVYMYHLRTANNSLACQMLKAYILERLVKDTDCPFIEDTIVTLIWMFTNNLPDDLVPNPRDLRCELEAIIEMRPQPLSTVAAYAAFVVSDCPFSN